ncbi:MAG: outer membrane beta-barrel protein [Candidatus Dadabacteria bacterium]|nr:outer membrane beta-barrel protein [Candidatus Dadabacteria bacterium]MDE0476789.1 outer membrane beta-barrel protein [Candidatus Dadabacteria bacterium]
MLSLIIPNAGFAGEGPDNPPQNETEFIRFDKYAGVFIGPGSMKNRITDVDGFADKGNSGSVSKYDDTGFVGGVIVGRKFDVGGLTLRMELDGTLTNVSASTNKLDPENLDETAGSEFSWIVSARGGVEQAVGCVTVFVTIGLAFADISNSVTDIDPSDSGSVMDPDDSFGKDSTEVGWVVGAGAEAALSDAWALRLEGLHMDFGESTHLVNRSADNRCCGPKTPRRAVSYEVENRLSTARLAIIRRF